jgi:hypothetical protein
MRHSNKMFLIPEELYHSLVGGVAADGSAKEMVRSRMQKIANEPSDVQAIKYQQEFKRYNKLLREDEERPTDVKLKNMEDIANVVKNNIPPPIVQNIRSKKAVTRPKQIKRKIKLSSDDVFYDAKEARGASVSDEPLHDRAMRYIRENADDLGVYQNWVLKQREDHDSALRTSNINKIVAHLLRNKGVKRQPVPVGYDEFKRRLGNHQSFKRLYEQSGRGTLSFKRHNKEVTRSFLFKPSLWLQ